VVAKTPDRTKSLAEGERAERKNQNIRRNEKKGIPNARRKGRSRKRGKRKKVEEDIRRTVRSLSRKTSEN